MADKDDSKYKLYKKRVKIAKILTVIGSLLLFGLDVLLATGIEGYNGGMFLIILLGVVVYYFIPQYASWKYEPTPERKKVCNLLRTLIAVFLIAFIGNILVRFLGII